MMYAQTAIIVTPDGLTRLTMRRGRTNHDEAYARGTVIQVYYRADHDDTVHEGLGCVADEMRVNDQYVDIFWFYTQQDIDRLSKVRKQPSPSLPSMQGGSAGQITHILSDHHDRVHIHAVERDELVRRLCYRPFLTCTSCEFKFSNHASSDDMSRLLNAIHDSQAADRLQRKTSRDLRTGV